MLVKLLDLALSPALSDAALTSKPSDSRSAATAGVEIQSFNLDDDDDDDEEEEDELEEQQIGGNRRSEEAETKSSDLEGGGVDIGLNLFRELGFEEVRSFGSEIDGENVNTVLCIFEIRIRVERESREKRRERK